MDGGSNPNRRGRPRKNTRNKNTKSESSHSRSLLAAESVTSGKRSLEEDSNVSEMPESKKRKTSSNCLSLHIGVQNLQPRVILNKSEVENYFASPNKAADSPCPETCNDEVDEDQADLNSTIEDVLRDSMEEPDIPLIASMLNTSEGTLCLHQFEEPLIDPYEPESTLSHTCLNVPSPTVDTPEQIFMFDDAETLDSTAGITEAVSTMYAVEDLSQNPRANIHEDIAARVVIESIPKIEEKDSACMAQIDEKNKLKLSNKECLADLSQICSEFDKLDEVTENTPEVERKESSSSEFSSPGSDIIIPRPKRKKTKKLCLCCTQDSVHSPGIKQRLKSSDATNSPSTQTETPEIVQNNGTGAQPINSCSYLESSSSLSSDVIHKFKCETNIKSDIQLKTAAHETLLPLKNEFPHFSVSNNVVFESKSKIMHEKRIESENFKVQSQIYEEKLKHLKNKVSILEEEVANYELKEQQQNCDICALNLETITLKTENKILNEQLSDNKNHYQNKILEICNDNKKNEIKIIEETETYKQKILENQALKKQNLGFKNKNDTLIVEKNTILENYNKLEKRKRQLQEYCKNGKATNIKIISQIKDLEEKIEDSKNKIKNLIVLINEKVIKNATLMSHNKELKKRFDRRFHEDRQFLEVYNNGGPFTSQLVKNNKIHENCKRYIVEYDITINEMMHSLAETKVKLKLIWNEHEKLKLQNNQLKICSKSTRVLIRSIMPKVLKLLKNIEDKNILKASDLQELKSKFQQAAKFSEPPPISEVIELEDSDTETDDTHTTSHQTVASTSSHTVASTSSHTGASTSSHTVASTSSHTVASTSSHTGASTSSHTGASTSSHTGASTSSHTGASTSSHTGASTSSHTGASTSSHTGASTSSHTGASTSSHKELIVETQADDHTEWNKLSSNPSYPFTKHYIVSARIQEMLQQIENDTPQMLTENDLILSPEVQPLHVTESGAISILSPNTEPKEESLKDSVSKVEVEKEARDNSKETE